MRRALHPRLTVRGATLGLLGMSLFVAVACGEDRRAFPQSDDVFGVDASKPDAPTCGLQCSLDGRSIVQTCTGEVVETCPPDLACGAATCQEPCAAAAADRSSNGCEFYLQTPRLSKLLPQSCHAAFIVNTSTKPVDLSLELEGKSLDVSKALFRSNPADASLVQHTGPIAPGESVVLFLSDRDPTIARSWADNVDYAACPAGVVPVVHADIAPIDTGIGSSFHLKTSGPVSAAAMYPFGGAGSFVSTATLLLPVATWSKEHIIVNGWEASHGQPGAQIVASEDDTEVTLIPTRDVQGGVGVAGAPARVPVTYKLGKGQYLQFMQHEELSGSFVTSNKPTTVFGGNECANVPSTQIACDILNQQLPSFEQWGNEYVGAGYRPRLGNEHESVAYRIVAARDGTRLDYDPVVPPGAPIELSAGQVVTFHSGTGDAFVVRSQDVEHPIYLAAYMSGSEGQLSFGGRGDPEFVNVVPTGQYLSSYTFYADPTYAETSLVIIRAKQGGAFKDVWLECAGNVTGFRPIGTRGEYELARVDLSRDGEAGDTFGDRACRTGVNRMKSEGPFAATIWGWDRYVSYAYPGGMAQRKLVDTPLVPVH
ncbi:MAG: hypothetical protein BGO98_16655 [Myxococcales bacterium 68-20]|nr:MAG: hypothetical protein BGO98_16655 [Myxococcales bacterium 68-20]